MNARPASRKIGIRIPSWATFTRGIFSGVTEYMRENGRWRLETPLESESELDPVRIDEDWRGDGLIVFRFTQEEAGAWLANGVKVVNFSSETLDPRIPTITPDNVASGRLAAAHLLATPGLRSFAFWGDPQRLYSRERAAGFAEALKKDGRSCALLGADVYGLPESERAAALAATLDRLLPGLERPCGVFAKDDLAAMEVIDACSRLGYAVPRDVAVIGCNDDFIFCHTTDAPLTSVGYPGPRIGRALAETLDALMLGGRGVPARTLIPPDPVVVRESTDAELAFHPHVRQAIRFIRAEAGDKPLKVNEVLARIPASRSALKERFAAETGETINGMIARMRYARLLELLADESLPMKVVSQRLGFAHAEEMPRFFRRMAGVSPSEWRRARREGAV